MIGIFTRNKRRNPFFLNGIFLVFVLGMVLAGYFYFGEYLKLDLKTKREKLSGGLITPQEILSDTYPRLFNQYLLNNLSYPGIVNALRNWNYVILSDRVPSSEINLLRSLNSGIKIGRYISPTSIYKGGDQSFYSYTRDYYNKVSSSNWWMHDVNGGIIKTWLDADGYDSLGTNFTSFAPADENGEKFYNWFPQFVYDRILQGIDNDFILADEIYSGYVWLESLYSNGQIDIDNDGVADGDSAIDSATRNGLEILFTNLRNVMDVGGQGDKIIIGNGVNIGSFYPALFNGAMREGFPYMHGSLDSGPNPYGYHWKDNMFNPNYGYLATESIMRQPNFSLIAASSLNAGSDPIQPPTDSNFERHLRFSLGSTLLGNGHFGISNWGTAWWFNNYYTFNNQKGYLGSPQGSYNQILVESRQGSSYGVYERNFSQGKVIINASGYSQNISLSGNFLKVQDSSAVNGSIIIPAWDALILVNAFSPPQCTPNWSCTDWSACMNGTQTRVCSDQNSCGTSESKPSESMSCNASLYALAVSKSGQGSGVVSGTGINCGLDCSEQFIFGSSIVLTAFPDLSSLFSGWSGACSGLGSCVLSATNDLSVIAAFNLNPISQNETLSVSLAASSNSGKAPLSGVDLTATISGTASGLVNYTFYCNRSDSGINITSLFEHKRNGSSETTYAVNDICSYGVTGTYTAKVIVERGSAPPAEARTVINVTREPVVVNYKTLKILKDGKGMGVIKSNPSGINCGDDCTEVFAEGSSIVLTAELQNNSTFDGWLGVCKGKNTCIITMTKDFNVTAVFGIVSSTPSSSPPSKPNNQYQEEVQKIISQITDNSKIIIYTLAGIGVLALIIAILY